VEDKLPLQAWHFDLIKARSRFIANFFDGESGDAAVCSIHNVFHSDESLDHNCIGCNLASALDAARFYFDRMRRVATAWLDGHLRTINTAALIGHLATVSCCMVIVQYY